MGFFVFRIPKKNQIFGLIYFLGNGIFLTMKATKQNEQVYFETLGEARQSIEDWLKGEEIELNEELVLDYLGYQENKDFHFEIKTIKEKITKKYLHVCIYRLESGRYELVKYAL